MKKNRSLSRASEESQSRLQNRLPESEVSSASDDEPVAELELELGEGEGESLLSAAAAKLRAEEEAARLIGGQEEGEGKKARRLGRKEKARRPGPSLAAETLAETIGVPLLLGLAAMVLVEEARPTEAEAKAFLMPIFRVLMRHIPLTGKLNADLIDLVSAFAAAAAWYARVRDHLKVAPRPREERKAPVPGGDRQVQADLLGAFIRGGAR